MVDESYFIQTMQEPDSNYEPATKSVKNDIIDAGNIKMDLDEQTPEKNEQVEGNRVTCNLCESTFSRRKGLLQHIRFVHEKEKNFVCEFCTKRFARKNSLTTHVKDIHEQSGDFVCGQCDRRYAKEKDLRNHERKHSDEKPFQCDNCGDSFKRQFNLFEHYKIHLGLNTKEFQCIHCGKQFGTKGVLDRHIQCLHVNEFPCENCDSKFRTKKALNEHVKFHFGVREFKCYVCDKPFSSNRTMKHHAHSVHIHDPCILCENTVNDEAHIEEHLRTEARKNKHKRKQNPDPPDF